MPFFTSNRRSNNDLGFGSSMGTRRRGQTDTSSSSTLLPTTIAAERRSPRLNHQATTNTCNSFLLGGNYYPGKDKKRRQLRRRALWYRLFCSSPLRQVASFVCIGFLALWYAVIPISEVVLDYGETIANVQRNSRDITDWLLLDNSMVMNLPSTKEGRKQAFKLSADRQRLMFGSEGGRQSRLDLLRAISPEWFTRNEEKTDNPLVQGEKNNQDSGAFATAHADDASSRKENLEKRSEETSQHVKHGPKGRTTPRNPSATAPPIQEAPLSRASSQNDKSKELKRKQQTVDNRDSTITHHQLTNEKNEQAENTGEQHLVNNEETTRGEQVEKREEAIKSHHITNNEGNNMAKPVEKEEPNNIPKLESNGEDAEAQKLSSNGENAEAQKLSSNGGDAEAQKLSSNGENAEAQKLSSNGRLVGDKKNDEVTAVVKEDTKKEQRLEQNEGNFEANHLEQNEDNTKKQDLLDHGESTGEQHHANSQEAAEAQNLGGNEENKAAQHLLDNGESTNEQNLDSKQQISEGNAPEKDPELNQVEGTQKLHNDSADSKVEDKTHHMENSAAIVAKSELVVDGQSESRHLGRVSRTLQNMNAFQNMSSCPTELDPADIRTTLVIQSSQERLWILKETCNRWKDPIIVVVLLTERSNDLSETEALKRESCQQLTILRHSVNTTGAKENDRGKYPINRLRNLGLDAVQTSHVLILDIDLVPSQELHKVIQSSLQNEGQTLSTKQAIVVPAFERIAPNNDCLENGAECMFGDVQNISKPYLPSSFEELTKCVSERSECRVFQSGDNPDGHSSTRSASWLEGNWYENDENGVQRKKLNLVPCFDSLRYEPYVVIRWCPTTSTNEEAKPMAPYYDERFYGYGKNKIEYISHLRFLGYQFAILPEGFVIHSPHSPSKVKKEWEGTSTSGLHSEMDKLYGAFLKELFISEYQKQREKYQIVGQC